MALAVTGMLVTAGMTVVAATNAAPAAAAVSPSQQWPTATTGTTQNGGTVNMTFGTSGVTAAVTATAPAGALQWPLATGFGGGNANAYLSPDVPAGARGLAQAVQAGQSITNTATFNKPIINPEFHVINMDGSVGLLLGTTTTGATATLTRVSGNNRFTLNANNQFATPPKQADQGNCENNDGSNPAGACGSIRMNGLISSFRVGNSDQGLAGDAWLWSASFPTAPLTKQFSPNAIAPGGSSTLTFSIANPANEAQTTLTPLGFTDSLPAGVTLRDGNVTTANCGSPTSSGVSTGSSSVSFDQITVAVGATCTISVNVTAATSGVYTNDNSNLSTTVGNLVPNANTSLTVAPNLPIVTCTTDPVIFNTGYNSATGGQLANGGVDERWTVAGGLDGFNHSPTPIQGPSAPALPPADAVYSAAYAGKANSLWTDSQSGESQWISAVYPPTAEGFNQSVGGGDWYYRYQFSLAPEVDPSSFELGMRWLADNSVAGVWVNNVAQTGANLPQSPAAPYDGGGFLGGNAATTTMAGPWQTGLNTILVQVKSNAAAEGFSAEVTSTALCPEPTYSVEKIASTATAEPGDTVTYSVTVTNTGEVAYTADRPASFTDDLSGVLDDAAYNGDATQGATVTGETLSWSGPLAIGESTTITYSVTVTAPRSGDGEMVNTVTPTGDGGSCLEAGDCTTTTELVSLDIDKTTSMTANSRPGDTVTYTVTATNEGPGDYTADIPAFVADSLAGVLDDATYNGDVVATIGGDTVGAPTFAGDQIRWSGPLAAGRTVTLTYSVTLTGAGDGEVRNVAWAPPVPNDPNGPPPTPPVCDPVTEDGTDPVTGEPCAGTVNDLPRLTVAKTADTTELPADGGVVTYTVTVTNVGPGAYTAAAPATVTDDLSDVLDDGEFGEIIAPATGAAFDADAEELTWSGPLAAGASATIQYTVTYDSTSGDNVLYNVVCVPEGQQAPGAEACADVQIPGAALEVDKSVDPASGTAVTQGQTLTYTLTFTSTGEAAAAVDKVDDLSDVLDDATLVAGSITVSSDGLDATLTGTDLAITGSVPAGETITITYQVTVNAFADQGNHTLANVVQNPDGTCEIGGCPETENPVRHFSVTKTADPSEGVQTGDVVTYTVTVVNDGAAAYTGSVPAGVSDDMTDVLDDATYNNDADAVASDESFVQDPTFTSPILNWSGPVAVGESVEITYSVTVTNLGNANLLNTASPVCVPTEICDPSIPPVEIPLPRVTPSKSSDPAADAPVEAGQVVTYTLTFTNDGQAAGPVDATDDMSDVLDDAELTDGPDVSADGITAVFDEDAQTIRIEGDLAAGATVTVTYQVTIRPDGERGNNRATNIVTPDNPPVPNFPPPSINHPIGELDDWKTVDPASGTTVRPGQVMTYTLHFENTGTAPVAVDREDVLTQVLDDATVTAAPASSDPALTASAITDGRFAVTGSLAPAQVVTVTYQVTVNADGARGDDRLGNFLVNEGDVPPEECVPTSDERPDCTVNYVSNVVVTKSVDPASGTHVVDGQKVTYTVTFRNVSTNPDAADSPVDYTDHMAGVLDDATLTTGPQASADAVTATVDGQTIRMVGVVASGQTVTVTYAVTVKAWAAQGNHTLGNIVAVTGSEPICAPGSQLCTQNIVDPPAPGLAVTGGQVATWVVVTGLVLLVGGAALVLIRRRRASESANEPTA